MNDYEYESWLVPVPVGESEFLDGPRKAKLVDDDVQGENTSCVFVEDNREGPKNSVLTIGDNPTILKI